MRTLSYLYIFCALFVVTPSVAENSANQFMKVVDNRDRGKTSEIISAVVLIDKGNKRTKRTIHVLNKKYGKDEKNITFLTYPPRLKNTGFLAYDWANPNKANDAWIYLSNLRKVTRLATSNRADYFLGTDFTYGDMERLEVEDYEYQYAEKKLSKEGFTVLDATPKSKNIINKYGYKKIRYWVDDKKKMTIKAKFWLKDAGWIKYFKVSDIKNYSGVWVGGKEQMVLTKEDKKVHSTVLLINKVTINKPLDDTLFTTHGLESGR